MPELTDRSAPARSFLYAPGSSPRILAKVRDAGADAVVLDLEDAVAPVHKVDARRAVVAYLDAQVAVPGPPMHVRVNGGRFGFDQDDVAAIVRPGLAAIRVPSCEQPRTLRLLDTILTNLEAERGLPAGAIAVHALIESARGVAAASELAAQPRVEHLCFGATDFLADIRAQGEPHGEATLFARSQLVLASRVAGIGPPVDSVHTQLDDEVGLREGARLARRLGFGSKSVIHPRQLAVVHEVFTSSDDEVAWARRVLAAAEAAGREGRAALTVDGGFVDPAVVGRAESVLAGAREEGTA